MHALIGVDVGATSISGGLVDAAGDVVAVERRATHARGKGTAVETLLEVITAVLGEARTRELTVGGIGVGLAGVVDAETGTMADYARNHVREFANVPLVERITAATGLPAFVDNDANALALAERAFGVARGASSLALLAIGTEIGGAIMLGETLMRGRSGFGGELGHVPIDFLRGPRCICGGRGCAGAYLGGRVMAAAARRRAVRTRSKLVAMANGDPRVITSELVFEAARLDDPLARGLVDRACEALAALLAVIVNGLDPEVVVVTGGLAASLEPLREDIIRRTARYAYAMPLARTRIEVVSGDKARTVRGGAALVPYELRRRASDALRRLAYNSDTRRERSMPTYVVDPTTAEPQAP
ncbi:MAG TPA: ROK family protein [Terriglobales bacterium]|nr:ROK family protein [Terriglobales bacterium]